MRQRPGFVQVRGAREHNLKNVDVDIPRDALVAFTGISGSGKSSLAFGTVYAEAQRRYLESVAPYARRLIQQAGVPAVDAIEGLPPAVGLQQQRGTPGARSSVGSLTNLSSLLRMLYSRAGRYPRGQPMLYAEDFSPNTPAGACPHCHGLGRVFDVTEQSMVPDDSLTIRERAVAAWPAAWGGQNLRDILVSMGIDVDKPWRELPKKTRDWILFTEEHPTVPVYAGFTPAETRAARRSRMEPSYQGTFTGARRYVLQTFATTQSALMKKRVARFMQSTPCPVCHGQRLKPEALSVRFAGLNIAELMALPMRRLTEVLADAARGTPRAGGTGETGDTSEISGTVSRAAARRDTARRVAAGGAAHAASPDVRRTPNQSEEKRLAAQRIAHEVLQRVQALAALGLGYLPLDRGTGSLSPGELQRLRLATQIQSNLFGVVYVLDEPSAGLHPADAQALLQALAQLKAAGNSVLVVEHDMQVVASADWIVDVGPGAGEQGGEVLYSGPPAGLREVVASRTAPHLFDLAPVQARTPRTPVGWLALQGVRCHNLAGIDARFPLGVLTTVTGLSGAGKSSLVGMALADLVRLALGHAVPDAEEGPGEHGDEPAAGLLAGRIVGGLGPVTRLVQVDQKPIGRTPRSNLATYTGLFDPVRRLFADTPAARKRGYGAGRFSFNIAAGRCPTCEGEGFVSVELLFMPSVYAPCPTCQGQRYNPATLAVAYRGRNIAQVLQLSVAEAVEFFAGERAIVRTLRLLMDIGLGYVRLGQPATELSGGEAQRIKLATELQRAPRGHTLYLLDEPTTGLHPADAELLMAQLQGLVDTGQTVVLVEHDMRVAAQSDWVIDLGPAAGDAGGRVVACGTPAEVAQGQGPSAAYLAQALGG
jgi:excinuclease ABC subunit A